MHLFICDSGCEVFYGNKNCENVNLDVDDTTGNGPETMTLASQMPAPLDQTYVVWVCIFSCTSRTNSSFIKIFVDSFYMQKIYFLKLMVHTFQISDL